MSKLARIAFVQVLLVLLIGLAPASGQTIVDIALDVNADSGEFSTLIAALVEADLVDTLADPAGDFTVFAPTDAAFAALGLDASNIGTLDADLLTDVLLYHVAAGGRTAAQLRTVPLRPSAIAMLNGEQTYINVGFLPFLNGSKFVGGLVNIQADNGFLHVIDAVLTPASLEQVLTAAAPVEE